MLPCAIWRNPGVTNMAQTYMTRKTSVPGSGIGLVSVLGQSRIVLLELILATRRTSKKPVRKAAGRAEKARKTVQFIEKPSCTTCRKARRFLEKCGFRLNIRDLTRNRLTSAELKKLIGTHDHQEFLNPRSEIYRKKKMKDHPPSRREAVGMMAMNPDLIRRPVIVAGGQVVIGYDENGMIRIR
jgi:arsenate reductase (glutaredoxin)